MKITCKKFESYADRKFTAKLVFQKTVLSVKSYLKLEKNPYANNKTGCPGSKF